MEPLEVYAFQGQCNKCGRMGHREISCWTEKNSEISTKLTCIKCGRARLRQNCCLNAGLTRDVTDAVTNVSVRKCNVLEQMVRMLCRAAISWLSRTAMLRLEQSPKPG